MYTFNKWAWLAISLEPTYFFGAGASAILDILSNYLMGWVAGSLGEPDSHTKSGEQTGLLELLPITKKGESLGTRLQIKFPEYISHALF